MPRARVSMFNVSPGRGKASNDAHFSIHPPLGGREEQVTLDAGVQATGADGTSGEGNTAILGRVNAAATASVTPQAKG